MRPNVEVPGLFLGSPDRLYGRSSDVLCCVFVIVWMVQGGPSDFYWPMGANFGVIFMKE